MNLEEKWNKILEAEGMPEEPMSEQEKAAKADVELISTELMDPEAEIIARKLKEEDPRNVLGGFPHSMNSIVKLINNLQAEAGRQKVRPYIHASCVNGHDCVTLAHPDGKIYHYNTKNIENYSTEKMLALGETNSIYFIEK